MSMLPARQGMGNQTFDEADTQAFIYAVRAESFWQALVNHSGNGVFDFSHGVSAARGPLPGALAGDHFSYNGVTYNASQFENFLAGYAGAYQFGFGGYVGVVGAGILYDIHDNGMSTTLDQSSAPYINAGADAGFTDSAMCHPYDSSLVLL